VNGWLLPLNEQDGSNSPSFGKSGPSLLLNLPQIHGFESLAVVIGRNGFPNYLGQGVEIADRDSREQLVGSGFHDFCFYGDCLFDDSKIKQKPVPCIT